MDDEKKAVEPKLQWHPAFYAGLQIEFEKEAKELIFENEHQLGTKPKEVDVLITKKDSNYKVKKNIGRFFKKYNLIEYKAPGDSLSIDDFYKVCGYACFYKADSAFVNAIKVDEITVTLASFHKPREMLKCLEEEGRYQIIEIEKGLYYIEGGIFPIQLVVTSLISEKENFWLRNLTNKLKSTEKVCEQYKKNSNNELYKSVMNIIVNANKELFKEGDEMCQALYELYEDRLMEMAMEKAMEKATKVAEAKVAELAEVKVEAKVVERIIESQKRNIVNLMNNAHLTLEQALDILMIPEEERKLYNFG